MPVIECDVTAAKENLEAEGISIEEGNTEYEAWRATYKGATAVAYDDKIVIQGDQPADLVAILESYSGRVHLYFDGASHGNPGPAAIGWVLITDDGIVSEGSKTIGEATNNQAEYDALITGLRIAHDMGFDTIEIRGDSELAVEQVKGNWDVENPNLREKRITVQQLLQSFDEWTIKHVPRELNERADKLASEALEP
ncbi:MAG: ribonuclease HI [Halobacteriaceae archaeon]